MRTSFFLSVLSLFWIVVGRAQVRELQDSLRAVYDADTLRGEARMDLLNQLAFNEAENPERALQYANELINLAKTAGNSEKLGAGYLQKGNALITQRNLSKALEAYLMSAAAFDSIQAKRGQGTAYYSIAFTYVESGDTDKAEEWYRKSIAMLRNPELLATEEGPIQLASALYNAGELYMRLGNFPRAQEHFQEAQEIFEEQDYKTGYYYALGNRGVLFLKSGDLYSAEQNLREAIDWLEQDKDYAAASDFQAYMAELFSRRGAFQEAHKIAEQSLGHALRLGLKDQISESSLILARLDSITGNFDKAYQHLNLHMRYKDSMDVETVDLTRLEREKAELIAAQSQTELELQSQKQDRQRAALWAVSATALLLILIAGGSYGRYRYMRKTNKIISHERDRSESLLLNILPKETARELKVNGRVRAQRFESVTILFSDFRGFTHHAENMDPEELVESIDFYFSHFDTIMDKYGLEKIKTVGDAYMCAGGLPNPVENHAIRVVEAALEMMEFVEANKNNGAKGHTPFDMRIGINTGPVVAGVVGIKKFVYDIWGDAVNVASRMESSSEAGKINISEETYRLIREVYDCESRGSQAVKNHGEMNMYFVKGKKETQIFQETSGFPMRA